MGFKGLKLSPHTQPFDLKVSYSHSILVPSQTRLFSPSFKLTVTLSSDTWFLLSLVTSLLIKCKLTRYEVPHYIPLAFLLSLLQSCVPLFCSALLLFIAVHHHHHHHLPPWIRSFDLFRHRRIAIVSRGVHDHFLGGKGGWCVRLTTLPPSCAVVIKSGNLNFLEPSGSLQACNGTDLPLFKSLNT